jgi:hypothetical protein
VSWTRHGTKRDSGLRSARTVRSNDDPSLTSNRTEAGVGAEERRCCVDLSTLFAERPAHRDTPLAGPDASSNTCRDSAEERLRVVGPRAAEVSRTVERCPHDLGAHDAVVACEVVTRNPRRRDGLVGPLGSRKNSETVTHGAGWTANEAGRKLVVLKPDESLGKLAGPLERWRSGHVELHLGHPRLRHELLSVPKFERVLLSAHFEFSLERRRLPQGNLYGIAELACEHSCAVAAVPGGRRTAEPRTNHDR